MILLQHRLQTENEPDQMSSPVFKAFGLLKKIIRIIANKRFDLENNIFNAILQACDEIITYNLHNHSSLNICEKGSSKQITYVNIPETLGNEFLAYAKQVSTGMRRLKTCVECLFELPINDIPVAIFICAPERFGIYLVESLNELTQLKIA